jgi:hypothetical protein
VKAALEATAFIGQGGVEVARSGDGLEFSPAAPCGYQHTVKFVGEGVSGNVPQLQVTSKGCPLRDVVSPGGRASVTVNTKQTPVGGPSESWKPKYLSGVGTGTENQRLTVAAGSALTLGTGGYHLNFSFGGGKFATRCIEWSATAAELEEAVEELENVDSVLVERSTVGEDADNLGFVYSIFFDGNALRPRVEVSDDAPLDNDTSVRPGLLAVDFGGCSPFATTIDGVVTPLSNRTGMSEATGGGDASFYKVQVDRVEGAGFDLPFSASAIDVKRELELLSPTIDRPMHTAVSVFDDQDGLAWTLTYASNDGDVPELACLMDASLQQSGLGSSKCVVTTLVDGNTLGGTFVLDSSLVFPFDVSAEAMAAELSSNQDIGGNLVEVSRTPLDGRGGFVWSITFKEAEGDLPLLAPVSSLTGTGATMKVEEVVKGNQIRGSFALSMNGHASSLLSYDATASEIKAALEALDTVGGVSVVEHGYVDTESGRGWTVTFLDTLNPGDVAALVPTCDLLTGEGAAVLVREVVKGSEASGAEAKLSFSAPPYCSKSPTKQGVCGDPVSSYLVEWDTAADFGTSLLDSATLQDPKMMYAVQRVVTESPLGGNGDSNAMAGTFQLSFGGATTSPLPAHATALQVRDALEDLATIETVRVVRNFSPTGEPLIGSVDTDYGSPFVECSNASLSSVYDGSESGKCGALALLNACDLLQLADGKWYRARDMWTNPSGGQVRLSLARADDCAVSTTYGGATSRGSRAFGWSGGYEWTVTFLRLPDGSSSGFGNHGNSHGFGVEASTPNELLSAPAHDLWPRSSVLHVRGSDCVGCYYLPRDSGSSSGLTLGLEYFVRVSASNARGASPQGEHKSVVPNAVPSSPESSSLAVVSGHELEVFWCPPSASAGDVNQFEVQWDSSHVFLNVTSNPLAGCNGAKGGSGVCSVTGSAITGPCPYSFLIGGLTTGTEYFVRVAGRNGVPVQTVLPEALRQSDDPSDNTQWSGVLRATPLFVPPQPPRSVNLVVLDGNRFQVQVVPPLRDGGRNISHYEVDVDTELSFQTSWMRTVSFPIDILPLLHPLEGNDSPLVMGLEGLTPGTFYFVRVRAVSSVGDSLDTPAANHPLAPTQLAQPPSWALASPVDPTSLAPSTEIEVAWQEPPLTASGDGGTALTGYLVEWWETSSVVEEVMAVRLSWSPGDIPGETWSLRYLGEQTNGLKADATAANVRDALMNLYDTKANTNATNDGFLLGPLEVTRTTVGSNAGYVYSVTFKDDSPNNAGWGGANNGDMPVLPVEDVFLGSATSQSYEVVSGVRASGANEVQVITSFGTGEGFRGSVNDPSSGNPDDAVVRGFWRVAFAGSPFSAYLSTEANETEVEAALESLSTVGDVSVVRELHNDTATTGSDGGYRWLVTFLTPVGDRQALVLDTQYVHSTNGDAGMAVQDGDNEVDHLGIATCNGCAPGESPVKYSSALVDSDARAYLIQGLTPGTAYTVSVSALNKHGQGIRKLCNEGDKVLPPVVVPGLPRDVSVAVNYGSADNLVVTYTPPTSNGGADITHYRVELDPATTTDYRDPTTTFQSPISELFYCPSQPTYAVWTVTTTSGNASATLGGGHFALRLTRGGADLLTDAIPFDAPALAVEESSDETRSLSGVYCEDTASNNIAYCPSSRLVESGSMQSKVQALESLAGGDGVSVSRRALTQGAYVWSVTFLDAGDDFELETISIGKDGTTTELTATSNGAGGGGRTISLDSASGVYTDKVQAGVVHGACSGSLVMPSVGGLVTGQYYYARVFAYNQKGYGDPQTALTPEKPMVVPGRPTGVALEVYDSSSLKVIFHPPTDDGGDAVDSYLIEYATDPTFTTGVGNASVVMLSAGAPYYRVLPNLENGVDYFVRVLAHNSQGHGLPQASSPAFEHPHVEPSPPSEVRLGVTSDTMLTVGFEYPLHDGGDNLTHFKVEWDTAPSFSSLSSHPDKGSAVVSALSERSYTVEYLTTYKTYYVRVSGRNNAGWGQPRVAASPATTVSSSSSAAAAALASAAGGSGSGQPSLQVPGFPVSLVAQPGTHDGYLNIRFDAPRVPRHGIPCGGLPGNPAQCPTPVGGTEDAANGGAEVSAYKVEWSIDPDFSSAEYDAGSQEVQGGATAYTVRNLTIGNRYYTRVAARNIMGYSAFCSQTGTLCAPDAPQASSLSTNSSSWSS